MMRLVLTLALWVRVCETASLVSTPRARVCETVFLVPTHRARDRARVCETAFLSSTHRARVCETAFFASSILAAARRVAKVPPRHPSLWPSPPGRWDWLRQ